MSFDIDVHRSIGQRTIRLTYRSDARLVALVGPSGVGKTSILDMIAGVTRPDHGHIRIAGRTLFDGASGIDLPVEHRRAGYVFQDRRLFPHMRVRANLLYGYRNDGPVGLDDILAVLGIGHLLDRWPGRLSGGEAQRVAIGRALLANPHFLLLDEPLSSLDAERKSDILETLDRVRRHSAIPILMVTHDLSEAHHLSARIVAMGQAPAP